MKKIIKLLLIIVESVLLAYILLTNFSSSYSGYTVLIRSKGLYHFEGTFTMDTTTVYTNSSGDNCNLLKGTTIDIYGIDDGGHFMSYKPYDASRWISDGKITIDMIVEKESVKNELKLLRSTKENKLKNLRVSICLTFTLYFVLSIVLFYFFSLLIKHKWIIHSIIIVLLIIGVIYIAPLFPAR